MATLNELLGLNLIDDNPLTENDIMESYVSTKNVVPDISSQDASRVYGIQPTDLGPEPSNLADLGTYTWEALGLPAYSFLDTASFGALGYGISKIKGKEFEEEHLMPKTTLGRVTSAIGGTAGFVVGGPMKIGRLATQMAAKPFIKAAGQETVKDFVKRSSAATLKAARKNQFTPAKQKFVEGTMKKTLSHMSHQARWDQAGKAVAKNWDRTATNAINEIAGRAAATGKLTAKEAKLVATTFSKNIKQRPMQDFVDIMMKRHPNKFGYITGSMIQEGIMFGMIDAAMEGVHAAKEDRPYDYTAPLWGVGVGGAFGMLKLLPPAGKKSITSQDFKGGVRALFSKNHFQNMNKKTLVHNSEIIGDAKALSREGTSIIRHTLKRNVGLNKAGTEIEVDLKNPLNTIKSSLKRTNDKQRIQILKDVLNDRRKQYGKEMMGAAVSEDFKSSLANWRRVILGTGIMHIRTTLEIAQGHELEPVDVMTSLMIGAWLNRRGTPLETDMNRTKMMRIRRNLDVLGIEQPMLYAQTPSLARGEFDFINPLTDKNFESMVQRAKDLKIVSNVPEDVELTFARQQQSPMLSASQKSYPLFNRYLEWIGGASGYRYTKARGLITEKEAESVEKLIRNMEFDGAKKKIKSVDEFEEVLSSAKDKIVDTTEDIIASTVEKVVNNSTDWGALGYGVGSSRNASLETIPAHITVNENLMNRIRQGKIDGVESEQVINSLRHAQKMLDLTDRINKATKTTDPNSLTAEITSESQIVKFVEQMRTSEQLVKDTFKLNKKGLEFTWDDLADLEIPLTVRYVNKSADTMGKVFSDTENPNWNKELMPLLRELGLAEVHPTEQHKHLIKDYSNVTIEKPEGWKAGNEEALLRTVLGVISAKGNRSLEVDNITEVTLGVEQIGKLSQYLESNGVSTQRDLLDAFRTQITQRITSQILKESKLVGSDVAIMNAFAGLDVPLAKYSTMADGGTGFSVAKVDVISAPKDKRTDVYKDWKYISDWQKDLIKRGTVKGKEFIKTHTAFSYRDPQDLHTIANIIRRHKNNLQESAAKTLEHFITSLDPTTNFSASIRKFINDTSNDYEQLFNFIQGKGLITPKWKKGNIEYVLNEKVISDKDVQDSVLEYLNKFGVHSTDIQKLQDSYKLELDNAIEKGRGEYNSSPLTQDKFLKEYYPDTERIGTKFKETTEVKDLFDGALASKDPHRHLIEKMEIKVSDTDYIDGVEFLKQTVSKRFQNTDHLSNKYFRVLDDIQQMLVLRKGTIEVPKVSVYNSKANVTTEHMQRNPFTNYLELSEIPYIFVSGDMYLQHHAGSTVKTQRVNVFETDSPAAMNSWSNQQYLKEMKKHHGNVLKKFSFGENSEHKDLRFIAMGNAKDVPAVPKSSYEKIRDLFKEQIVDAYEGKATGEAKAKIDKMWDMLSKSNEWGDVHEDAFRGLVFNSMVKGRGNENKFIELLSARSGELADLGKRFNLYHTPSFRRIDRELMEQLALASNTKDRKLLENFLKRDVGFIVWNDDKRASIFKRNEKLLRDKGVEIKEMLGQRKDVSGFDSISFISAEFKRILELYYGVSQKGSNLFKPVISSSGEDYLFLGKTVFVHDPEIESAIFGKHKGLDILTTVSADKMKVAISDAEWAALPQGKQDRIRYMDKSVDEMLNLKGSDISEYIKRINMNKIGVTIIPDKDMLGKLSYTKTNYMNNAENAEFYNTFHQTQVERLVGSGGTSEGMLQKLTKDNLMKTLALQKLKSGELNGSTFEEMAGSPESLKHLGHHLQIAAMGGDVRLMGEQVLLNTLKSQLIDPILSPKSEIKLPHGTQRYGGKAVIKQSFRFRDLKPTSRKGEGKDIEINPGDIELPYHIREGSINFEGSDIVLRAIDKNGKVSSLKDAMIKKAAWTEDQWNMFVQEGNLGLLHDRVKRIFGDKLDIGVLVTRYPRTAPNDLAVLRLKGFLKKDHGNSAIVNDFDVMNIFEGDYDVDEVDFFWGMNRGTWKHVDRVKHHWVNTKDPSLYEGKLPGLNLLTGGQHNTEWRTFDANNRVFSKGIGVVQKTPRLLQHLEMIGVKDTDPNSYTSGMTRIFDFSNIRGQRVEIVMDYDNSSFIERSSLESQLTIDYWKAVSKKIVPGGMLENRNTYLFPKFSESIAKEDIKSLAERQRNHLLAGPNNSRIRIFRKFVDGKEGVDHDLNPAEITALQALMKRNSDFLSLTSEVYGESGGQKPGYEDLYSTSQRYFTHLDNISKEVYLKVRKVHGNSQDVKDMFTPVSVMRSNTIKELENALKYNNTEQYKKIQNEVDLEKQALKTVGNRTYMWHQSDPFIEGVKLNAKDISLARRGTAMERLYNAIYRADPFGNSANNGKFNIPLKGELYKELQLAATELLNPNVEFKSHGDIASVLPRFTKKYNEDIGIILSYKRLIKQINNSKTLSQSHREGRIKGIQKIIDAKQAVMKDLIPKEYWDTGDAKYLEKINVVDVTRDKDVIEATTQWYTLYPLVDKFQPKTDNMKAFYAKVYEAIGVGGDMYSEMISLGSSDPYKWRTMHNMKQKKKRMESQDQYKDVETVITEHLNAGYEEYGSAFLLNYSMPKTTETTIGIFKNIPMAVSNKPSGRLKRSIKFMLDKMNSSKNKEERAELKEAIESIVKRYSAFRNFFDSNFDAIPLADKDMMSLLHNAPGFSKNLKSVFDKYESIKIQKGTFAQDVFGMGPEYDNNMTFYRRLFHKGLVGVGETNAKKFAETESILSRTNQLLIENNYVDPISYMLLVRGVRKKLADLGLDGAELYGLEKGGNLNIFGKYDNIVLAGSKGGISIKPMAMLNDYRVSLLKRFIKQGQDIKKKSKVEDNWDQFFETEAKAGPCKKGLFK